MRENLYNYIYCKFINTGDLLAISATNIVIESGTMHSYSVETRNQHTALHSPPQVESAVMEAVASPPGTTCLGDSVRN